MGKFAVRSFAPELMDDLTDKAAYEACLADLAQVNWLTFTHAPVLAWLGRVSRGLDHFSVLDVACGHGDLLRAIRRWADKRGIRPALAGLDLNPGSASAAAAATPATMDIQWRTGDVFANHPDPKPDFIVTSQFTHHLDAAQLRALFIWMNTHARRGWLDVDLHRHPIAYYGFRLMSWVMRWHPVMRHDGLVSVTRGFTRDELITATVGLNATVTWKIPFRFAIAGQPPAR